MRQLCALALLPLLFAFHCAAQDSGERERIFLRTLEQFDAAKSPSDFAKAGDAWRGLNDGEFQNGAAYYNAGNAYMRAGQFGRAIAAYRKAKLYRPRDPFLDHNLRQAVTSAPGKLADTPAPWWSLVLFWNTWLSLPEKFFAVMLAGGLAALLVFAGFALRKRSFYWGSALLVFVTVLLSIDATITHSEATASNRAVIVAETIARKGMGENYEPAFNQPLKDGAEIVVAERSGAWVLAQVPGIGTGWVRRENIAD
jgi:tetratricopeptide (TPR) repeat protein